MDGWIGALEVVAVVIVLIVAALVLLAARRRWLSRSGGTFECSARLGTTTPSGGWALGIARYNGEMLEWFRYFSYAIRPRLALRRTDVRVLESRDPDPVEALALYDRQRVVRLGTRTDPAPRSWELAMDPESLTGLLSWLEAAPPGLPSGNVP